MKESKNKKTFDGKSGGSVGIGLALGLAIGLMMGVATDNIPMWMCLGISIGLCCGTAFGVSEKGKPTILMTKLQSRLTPTIQTMRTLTRTPTNITEQNKNTAEVLSSAVFLRLVSFCLSSAGIRPRARASFRQRRAFRQA